MFEKLRHRLIRENRIYIMPSGRGTLLLSTIVVMILTAATYNNNLIFILAFFLFALFVVSMLQTHYNLKSAKLEFAGSEDAFEGDQMTLLFHITQSRARLKRGLEVRTLSKTFKTLSQRRETLRPQDRQKAVRIEVLAHKRGVHKMPAIVLETYYPLGIFRAWKHFRPKGELTVYPKPEGEARLSTIDFDQGEDETGLRTTPDGDFGELKNYVQGESYHQIAWKHFALTGELYTKVHWGAEHKHYQIPWSPLPQQNLEAYLRQMSQWVMIAVEEDATFEIETPNERIEPGRGPAQARLCLRALAQVSGAA